MKTNFESIYEHIGFLLYGIANANGNQSVNERIKLNEFIESQWRTPVSNDTLSLHLVDCIHGGVRYAIVNSMQPEAALRSFSDYYHIHPMPFGETLKKKIVNSAMQLVAETHPENKAKIESYLRDLQKS